MNEERHQQRQRRCNPGCLQDHTANFSARYSSVLSKSMDVTSYSLVLLGLFTRRLKEWQYQFVLKLIQDNTELGDRFSALQVTSMFWYLQTSHRWWELIPQDIDRGRNFMQLTVCGNNFTVSTNRRTEYTLHFKMQTFSLFGRGGGVAGEFLLTLQSIYCDCPKIGYIQTCT